MFLDPVDNDAHHGKFAESTSFDVGVSWTEYFEIVDFVELLTLLIVSSLLGIDTGS